MTVLYGLSTLTYDLDGALLLQADKVGSTENMVSRRVVSNATLDGGSFVSDLGYSPSDRLFDLSIPDLTSDEVENIKRLFRLHSRFTLITREGAFLVNAKHVNYLDGNVLLSFLSIGEA